MKRDTEQLNVWKSKFGEEYTRRNTYSSDELDKFYKKNWGVTRSDLNKEFLCGLSLDAKILEVGCNVGQQLRHLQLQGFKNLYGLEIQQDAVEIAKQSTKGINIIQGSAFDIPFKNGWFDLVFTSGVLIHISQKELYDAMKEIRRCTREYIWAFEYFSPVTQEIIYQGRPGLLWKRDHCGEYLSLFPELRVVKEKKVKYLADNNVDHMFLLSIKEAGS